MLGEALSWYMTSVAEFWGSAIRIGLPQILLIILVICWLRKKGGSAACGKWCCRLWSCGWCGEEDESPGCDRAANCACTCGCCCCRQGVDAAADAEAGDAGE